LATDQKKARRQDAHIALIDESGLMMAPLVRRTWAPRGETPKLVQSSGGGPREKVSVAAALWLTPRRDQLGLYFQTLVNDFFNPWNVAAFLEALLVAVPGRVVVVWDGGSMHKGDPIRQTQEIYSDRITLERLPPYAPMLNPIEPLWSWLKYDRLSNFAPRNALELNQRVFAELIQVRRDQELLQALFHASDLPLPRALFS
jgi:putative transposase